MTVPRSLLPTELALLAEENDGLHPAAQTFVAEIVHAISSSDYELERNGARLTATRALDCLISPEPGDLVLAVQAGGRAFVLSVLARSTPGPQNLTIGHGDASVTISAAQLKLDASQQILAAAPEIRFEAATIGLFGRSLSFVGELLTLLGDRLRNAVAHQETVADYIATKARHRVTAVEGTDVQNIGLLSQSVEGTATLTAESAIVLVRKDLRLDGERISMG